MKIHPLTNCYPMMAADEMADLVSSISDHGLLFSVTVKGDTLLDGRNRVAACKEAGVKLRTEEYTGDDPAAFILDTNKRRNLDASQLSVVAARMANLPKGRPKKNTSREVFTQEQAAAINDVSVSSVKRAKVVIDADPALAEKVARGYRESKSHDTTLIP